MSKSVLIVDDSKYMRLLISDTLKSAGFEVVGEASNGEKAIDLALELSPDLITLDNILPDMIGLDIIKVLKDEEVTSKIIFISAVGQQSMVDKCMSLGASDYITKPFNDTTLSSSINRIFSFNVEPN